MTGPVRSVRLRPNRAKMDLSFAFAPTSGAAAVKVRRAFGDPTEKRGQSWMRAQRPGGVIVAGQFRFCQGGVDLLMANVMHEDRLAAFAALELGYQVVMALPHTLRDRAQT